MSPFLDIRQPDPTVSGQAGPDGFEWEDGQTLHLAAEHLVEVCVLGRLPEHYFCIGWVASELLIVRCLRS